MPDKTASGRATTSGSRGRARVRASSPSIVSCRRRHARPRKIGLALAGGGPLGRHLRSRRAAGARRFARRPRLQRARRLRRRVVGRLCRRRARQRHFAGADVPALHRRRRRRRAEARDLPAAGVRRIRPPPEPLPGLALRASMQYLRDPFHRGMMESFATLAQAMPTGVFDNRRDRRLPGAAVRRAGAHQRLPQARGASCSWSRPTSTPARRSPSARRATTTCRFRARSRRRARCPACFRRSRSTASTTSTARSTRRCTRRSRWTKA